MKPSPRSKQRGVAVIELALILPFLLLLTAITTDFGRAIYQYNSITKSVRDAVRYLSMQAPDSHMNEAKNLVVYGSPDGAGSPLVPGLTVSHVLDPTWQLTGANPVINTVTITVSDYQFQSMFANFFGLTFGDFTYNDISATMRAQL